jgi:Transmembrane amino acid transporter protein
MNAWPNSGLDRLSDVVVFNLTILDSWLTSTIFKKGALGANKPRRGFLHLPTLARNVSVQTTITVTEPTNPQPKTMSETTSLRQGVADTGTDSLLHNNEDQPISTVPVTVSIPSDDDSVTTSLGHDEGQSSAAVAWPQTFERSILLLASPILPRADAARYSKSPAPGLLLQQQHRRCTNDLDRGIYTPTAAQRSAYGSVWEKRNNQTSAGGSERNLLLPGKLNRRPSLDFKVNVHDVSLLDLQQQQNDEAKLYRQRLLMKSNNQQQQQQTKKTKHGRVSDGRDGVDGKASVMQCIFNLSNILMGVGLLGLPYVFRLTGYFGGFSCILVLAAICWRTAILIGRCLAGGDLSQSAKPKRNASIQHARAPLKSFPDIARASFGETGCYVLSAILYFEVCACTWLVLYFLSSHGNSL